MAEMGLGYGSEYQLLRFLGHHRFELENEIKKQTSIEGSLTWFDFPKDKGRLSLDKEYKGIEFLKDLVNYKTIEENWKDYWPGDNQNWDGIILNINQTSWQYILVEAKAHLEELVSDTDAKKEQSIAKISRAFDSTRKRFGISASKDWSKCYYQAANRLAFINFLLENGIKASLLNIYFINGWPNDQKNVTSVQMWEEKIQDEYSYLGINDNAKKYIHEVFLEC